MFDPFPPAHTGSTACLLAFQGLSSAVFSNVLICRKNETSPKGLSFGFKGCADLLKSDLCVEVGRPHAVPRHDQGLFAPHLAPTHNWDFVPMNGQRHYAIQGVGGAILHASMCLGVHPKVGHLCDVFLSKHYLFPKRAIIVEERSKKFVGKDRAHAIALFFFKNERIEIILKGNI